MGWRVGVPWVVIAAMGVAMSSLAACASTQQQSHGQLQPHAPNIQLSDFGGYQGFGATSSVGAEWRVPGIDSKSASGRARTWIGAESPTGDFIQLGTTEDRSAINGALVDEYRAFWSDTSLGFRAQTLGVVSADDSVSAAITQTSTGWTLRLSDLTNALKVTQSTTFGAKSRMSLALWVQEDPRKSPGNPIESDYPKMAQPSFANLMVNGHPPALAPAEGQILASPNGATLLPGPIVNDGFTMDPGTPAEGQYVRDIAGLDYAIQRFHDGRPVAGAGDPQQRGGALIAAILTFNQAVRRQTWPTSATGDIGRLLAHSRLLGADLIDWESASASGKSAALNRYIADARQNPEYAGPVRSDVGLP